MDIQSILKSRELKGKDKAIAISKLLLEKKATLSDLLIIAEEAKGSDKATCIESIEFATKQNPKIASAACFSFVTKTLLDKAPRVKWESAKVIGNISHLFPAKLDDAIGNLLTNAEFPGTVVRWSAAFALGEVIKLKTKRNKELIPAIEAIIKGEEKNSIRKIYQSALKSIKE